MNSAFVIIDVEGVHDWPERFPDAQTIDPAKRPTIVHTSREVAEKEALRLARMHPGGRFAVFEAMQITCQIDAPTHVNLKGEVLLSSREARLVSITEGVPF